MAPASGTCEIDDGLSEKISADLSQNETKPANVYESLLPKNDPKFIKPLRDLERRIGFLTPLVYTNVAWLGFWHVLSVVGLAHWVVTRTFPMWQSIAFAIFEYIFASFGVTGGAHRLWSHKAYKAKTPLKIILLMAYSTSGQLSLTSWVRDHHVHHKGSDTPSDPHDATRGFVFSHLGWLMMKKLPQVSEMGRKIDMSDFFKDPLIRFYNRHFWTSKILFCFLLPWAVPVFGWGETWTNAIYSQVIRYVLTMNATGAINSFAHMFGNKPFDHTIQPSQNWGVSFVVLGEGWHNYHHSFPWDYKASELGTSMNLTTRLLDMFAAIGWAYDLREASPSLIKAVAEKKGDQTWSPKVASEEDLKLK